MTADNVRSICALRVTPAQERLVTSAAVSLAEAFVHPEAWCRAIYSRAGILVGFVMLHDTQDGPGYMLWRLLVDARYQRCGYGRAAVLEVVDYVTTRPAAEKTRSLGAEVAGIARYFLATKAIQFLQQHWQLRRLPMLEGPE